MSPDTFTQNPSPVLEHDRPEDNLTGMIVAGVFAGGFIATTLVICAIIIWRCRNGDDSATGEPMIHLQTMHSNAGAHSDSVSDHIDLEAQVTNRY